jgi:hypothetical protein
MWQLLKDSIISASISAVVCARLDSKAIGAAVQCQRCA